MNNPQGSKSLNWWFLFTRAGLAGALFGGLSILALIHGWEGKFALLLLAVLGAGVLRRGLHRPVLHGFGAGFIAAFVAVELQALFLPLYFQNNPEYAAIEIPFGVSARLATFLGGPVQGLVAGLLVAAFVWGLRSVVGLFQRSKG